MSPTAAATPFTLRILSSTATGDDARTSPKPVSTESVDRTYASTSRNTSVNSRSKVLLIVSEKIVVPDKNDVPRMIANEVSKSRPLRATVIFRESRNIAVSIRLSVLDSREPFRVSGLSSRQLCAHR